MCFSATASFASAAILGVAGIASLKKIQSTKQILFAAVPLLFSFQQLAEGFVWLSFTGIVQPPWQNIVIRIFLVFALIIWPIWISVAMLMIEKNKTRKIVQYLCLASGLVFAAFATSYLFAYNSSALIKNYHVYYALDFPNKTNPLVAILYVSATVLPLVTSSVKKVPIIGGLIFVSYLITKYYYSDYIISVWCFFGASVSGMIYLLVSNRIKSFEEKVAPVAS